MEQRGTNYSFYLEILFIWAKVSKRQLYAIKKYSYAYIDSNFLVSTPVGRDVAQGPGQ